MAIEYRIIWVDDTPDWVDSVIGEIEDHIRELEFEPLVDRFSSGEGFIESCSSVDIDLIIVDYNLPAEKGNTLISNLRSTGVFNEVVFYSQDRPPESLLGPSDGVFRSMREDAVDKIKHVIDLTVHKLRDIEVVRGLIIASTIDMEVQLEEIMMLIFGEKGLYFQEKVLEKHVYDFEKKVKFVTSHFNDLAKEADGEAKLNLQAIAAMFGKFAKEVIDNRNILAHSRKTMDGEKMVLKGINNRTKEIVFDKEWLSNTRKLFSTHISNLKQARNTLVGEA